MEWHHSWVDTIFSYKATVGAKRQKLDFMRKLNFIAFILHSKHALYIIMNNQFNKCYQNKNSQNQCRLCFLQGHQACRNRLQLAPLTSFSSSLSVVGYFFTYFALWRIGYCNCLVYAPNRRTTTFAGTRYQLEYFTNRKVGEEQEVE